MGRLGKPLRVVSPCSNDWNEMTAVRGGRHCAQCDKVVTDFTRLTERQAIGTLLLFGGEGMCGRMHRTAAGDPVFRPEPRKPRPLGGSAAAIALGIGVAACHGEAPPAVPVVGAPAPSHETTPHETTAHESTTDGSTAGSSSVAASSNGDRDGDGVADADDKCPDQAGKASADGCPVRIIIAEAGDMPVIDSPRFTPGSADLGKDADEMIQAVAQTMKDHPEIPIVEVHGHADALEKSPELLSKKRAQAVIDRLVKLGANPSRLVPIADGATRPIDVNKTPEGRANNRRVQFNIVYPSPSST